MMPLEIFAKYFGDHGDGLVEVPGVSMGYDEQT